ncbi:MAG: hypothetical protein ABI824_15840 [Acidobacteriota bacterium]
MPDLDKIAKRPLEYLWESGVAPLASGSTFFLLGSSDLVLRFLPKTSAAQEGVRLLAICCVIAASLAIRSVKKRLVFPRAGHVEPVRHYGLILLLVCIPLALTIWQGSMPDLNRLMANDRLIVTGFAVWFAVMSMHYGRKQGSPLLIAFGVYLLGLALLIWWLPLRATERFGLLEAGAGGPLTVYGAARLHSFLKSNPLPDPQKEPDHA